MKEAFQKLTVGVAGPVFGFAISISTTQAWLQIFSLSAGLVVGLLTIVSICFSIDRKIRRRRLEIKYNRIIEDDKEQTTTI